MTQQENHNMGNLNTHHIMLVMKESIRRAVKEIRRQRFNFEAKEKITDYSKEIDMVTSADIAAQEIFKHLLDEHFPFAGIIAEENFARKCTATDANYYFTIDPLDGTKAYGRRQSHAIASMISFVYNGTAEATCIGDVMTEEFYINRPGSENVYRVSENEVYEKLSIDESKTLRNQHLALRTDPRKYSKIVQNMTDPQKEDRLFKEIQTSVGSIGTMFARLWKSEIGGIVIQPSTQTPWDMTPLIAPSYKLGFICVKLEKNTFTEYNMQPLLENTNIENELLFIHKSRLPELKEWFTNLYNI
ncbi:MAG: inositol monophosphatase family protein [Minisyncoccia bacterium]